MNFNFQIQPLKSQIINMRFQIDNIELQMNNNSLYPMNIENTENIGNTIRNNCQISEQLLSLSIQLINTGIQAFNIGKEFGKLNMQNYLWQLKQISDQINIIIINENNFLQQMIMEQQMDNQNYMMKCQNDALNKVKKIDFINKSIPICEEFITIEAKYGEKVKDVLNRYLERIGCHRLYKKEEIFQYKGNNLDRNEERVIEDYFSSSNLYEPIIIKVSYN